MIEQDPTERKADVFAPLVCPGCNRSAYDVNMAWLTQAETIEPEMLRKSDPNALDAKNGNMLDCPYCGGPLAIATIYPILGGGHDVKLTFLTKAGKTS